MNSLARYQFSFPHLCSVLPAPRNASNVVWEPVIHATPSSTAIVTKGSNAPPYGKRQGWIPRVLEDFGDGGAYPEIHVAQYPLDMGRKETTRQQTVPVTTDAQGRIKYEALVASQGKVRQARPEQAVGHYVSAEALERPSAEEEAETTAHTRAALERVVGRKLQADLPSRPLTTPSGGPEYIRYTPSQSSQGGRERIVRVTAAPVDPLEPPKFTHKKVPRGPPSPPAPVMHSPPRKVSQADQQAWKIPPCISNWKNSKGYTIPLDKRLAADGRGLQEFTVNDNFAKFSEALYLAERSAREEVSKRAEVEQRLKIKEKEQKEEMLRKMAQEARRERSTAMASSEGDIGEATEKEARRERDEIRQERQREIQRSLRMQRNRSAASRNADRDVSERIALGQALPKASSETQFDQRLFNQTEGMSSGFGDDEGYNIYSKPLFQGSSATQLYRPKGNVDTEAYGGEEDYAKLLDTSKFHPDKGFQGAEKGSKGEGRSGPVEFEAEDPFGLDEFLTKAKTSSKGQGSSQKAGNRNPLDQIGGSGHMNVASGDLEGAGSSKRSRIAFESSSDSSESKRRK